MRPRAPGVSACNRALEVTLAAGTAARRVWLWAACAAVLASLPSLLVGFSSDDLSQRLMLEGRAPGYTGGWLGLYDFTPPNLPPSVRMEEGLLPWFTDPELELRFFRPLSSATLALDHALFGRNALLAHVQSVLWMAVLAGVAGRLYQRWFSAPVALLASIVFALSGVHAMPVSWLAARHTLVAATFGVLSLWAWLRLREDQYRPGLALAVLALVASLSSSESGLVAVALMVSYELGTRGVRRGLVGAAIPIGLGLGYLALYAALGYGTLNSSFYVSPFDAPLEYLIAAFWGVPALCAELLLGVPSLIAGLGGRSAQVFLACAGVGALVGAVFLLRTLRGMLPAGTGRVLAWLSLGSLVSLLALVGAPVTGRVLPLPLLGAAAVAGNVLWGSWAAARGTLGLPTVEHSSLSRAGGANGRKRWWPVLGLVVLFQLGLSPLVRLGMPFHFMQSSEVQEQIARTADMGTCSNGGSLYLVNGSDPTLALYAAVAIVFHTPEKAGGERLRVLSMAPQPHRLSRTAPGVLELEVLGPRRQENPFELLFRAVRHPLEAGQSVQLSEVTVRVDEISSGLFTRARFEFRRDLEQSRSCLMVWRDGRLENLPLPPIGESVRIEHEPGPLGL